jgi:hypothetical protein
MRKLVKDQENNVMVLVSPNGFIPPGYTEVPSEEVEAEEIILARKNRLGAIRAERDSLLLINDKNWLIASKKGESTTSIETEAQNLRDIPEMAEDDLALLESVEDIEAYNPFEA